MSATVRHYTDTEIAALSADYAADGVVHLPGFVGAYVLASLQAIVDRAAAAIDQPAAPDRAASFSRAAGRLTMRYLWRDDATLRRLLLNPQIAEFVSRVIGSRTLRFWFDLTFIHHADEAGTAGIGTPWHHDVPTYSFKGELMPSLWIALTPTSADLSRLMFIAGSHRNQQGLYRSPDISKPENGEADGFVDLPDFDTLITRDEVRMLTWDCKPGDAILLHPGTVHGARGNIGQGPHARRVSLTTRWLGDDVRFFPLSYSRACMQRAIAETGLMFGQRPHGEWFPLLYDQDQGMQPPLRLVQTSAPNSDRPDCAA